MWAALVVVATAAAGAAPALATCPRQCECKWRSGKESAVCARASLTSLPPMLDPGTQLLDLNGNRITTLPDDAFSNAGLINLQRVYLSDCGLKNIKKNAFKALVNLVELDLSHNRLEYVPSHAFSTVPELRDLRLDSNFISKLKDEAFLNLPHLVRLDLSSCKITEIEPRAFAGVEASLEYLKLDKNKLHTLHAAAMAPLRTLQGLELANNPWECTCELRPLRDWMLRKNVPTTIGPECALPPRLMGRTWDRLDLDDFACLPEISPTLLQATAIEGNEVTLACRVRGVPAPRVRWLRSGRSLTNSSATVSSGATRVFILKGEDHLSNLTIRSVDLQDTGPYICAAENRAGRAEASVTLAVEKKPPGMSFRGRILFVISGIVALVVIGFCIFGMLVYDAKKKSEAVRWNEQIVQNRPLENYSKMNMKTVEMNNIEEIPRKRGDYRNVPSQDTEDEAEEIDSMNPKPALWKPQVLTQASSACRWSREEQDLHIPRLSDYSSNVRSCKTSAPANNSLQEINFNSNRLNNNSCRSQRPTALERLDNDLSGSDSEKNYPDLIEMSSARVAYSKSRRDPPNYFYTMPRRTSQSPLLDSRRSSSGADSTASGYDWKYRKSGDGRRSNSFLDLSGNSKRLRRNPSLPTSPIRNTNTPSATPLLDLSGLSNYSRLDRTIDDSFDFRASQLERFLDEYRALREQLSRMKETREHLQRSRVVDSEEYSKLGSRTCGVAVTVASSVSALADAASPLALSPPTPSFHDYSKTDWLTTSLYHN